MGWGIVVSEAFEVHGGAVAIFVFDAYIAFLSRVCVHSRDKWLFKVL